MGTTYTGEFKQGVINMILKQGLSQSEVGRRQAAVNWALTSEIG